MPPSKLGEELEALSRVSQGTAARVIGVTARSLRDWVGAPRNVDGSYDLSVLVPWVLADRLARARLDASDPDMAGMLAGGENSPALERWRLAKARLAEMDVLEREGKLVPVESLRGVLAAIGSRYRSMMEGVLKLVPKGKLGEARALVDEAFSDVEGTVSGAGLGDTDGHGRTRTDTDGGRGSPSVGRGARSGDRPHREVGAKKKAKAKPKVKVKPKSRAKGKRR